MMKPVLISALDLWASWQREAALNITRAALMPLAAFASMARSAEAARGQRPESDEGRPPVWQGGGRVTSISDVRGGQQDRSFSGEACAKDADANLGTQTEMRKALEEGCEALREAAAAFIAASKSVSEAFSRSAGRHIAASDQAAEALLTAASASSERFAAVAYQAADSLREAVVGLSEASKELSGVAREASEALKKSAAPDEIRQARTPTRLRRAAATAPERRSPPRPRAPRAKRTAFGASPLVRARIAWINRCSAAGRPRPIGQRRGRPHRTWPWAPLLT